MTNDENPYVSPTTPTCRRQLDITCQPTNLEVFGISAIIGAATAEVVWQAINLFSATGNWPWR